MLSKTHSKYIQSLHHKKFRDEGNVFIAEGSKTVPELLSGKKFECAEILATAAWLQQNSLLLQKHYHGPVNEVLPHEMEKISTLSTPGNVMGIFKKRSVSQVPVTGTLSLVLDAIQDPGNMGTIIRTADWFGVHNIICSENTADMYNPKVVQSTMGSLGRVNVLYTDLPQWLEKNKGMSVYAAVLDGTALEHHKKIKEGLIVIGNESKGISRDVLQYCTEKITITRVGEAESLNAAVAAGIILSHLILH